MPRMTTFVRFRNASVHPFTPGNIELVFTPDETESDPACELPRAIYHNHDWFNPGGSNTFVLFGTNNVGIYAPPFLTCSCVSPREEPPSVVYPGCTACVDEKYALAWRLDTRIELANPLLVEVNNPCNINWESDDICRSLYAGGVEAVRWLIYRGLGEVRLVLRADPDESGLPTEVRGEAEQSTSGYFFVPAQWNVPTPIVPCTPGGADGKCPDPGPALNTGITGVGVRATFHPCVGTLELEVYNMGYSQDAGPPPGPITPIGGIKARWVYRPETNPRDCVASTRLRLWDEITLDWDISNVRTIGTVSTHMESGTWLIAGECVDCATAPKRSPQYNVPCNLKAPFYVTLEPLL